MTNKLASAILAGMKEWPDGVENSIKPEDVLWVMDWSGIKEDGTRHYPDKPEQELKFEEEGALAILLLNEVIFLNTHWWNEGWPEEAKRTISLCVNCSDVFAWGCADAEEISFSEIRALFDLWIKHPQWGGALWCMIKRRQMPQSPVAEDMKKHGIDVDAFGVEHSLMANHYDGVSRVFAKRKYEAYCDWERSEGREPRPFDKNWWDGWREYTAANLNWHTESWQAEDDAARTAWRVENGYEAEREAFEQAMREE